MTSTAHPSLEVLSEYAEGLLPTDDLATVDTHLEQCATCRDRLDELLTLPRLLRGAETPPMPDEVGDRVLAALAAEADRRAADAGVVSLSRRARAGREDREDRRPERQRERGRRRGRARLSRALGVAAGVAVLGAAGTIGFQVISADQPDQGAALHSTDQPRSADSRPRTYVLDDGEVTLSARSFADEVRSAVRPGEAPRPDEGRSDGQGQQGESLDERGGDGHGKIEPGPGRDNELFGSEASPERCAVQTVGATDPSAVLDQTRATYDGKPAILVITEGRGPGTVRAFVVTGCPTKGVIARDADVGIAR